MKIRHIILGIGALAAGAAVLYYLTKEKSAAEVQPAPVKEAPPAEPEVSEEDKAILDDIFEPEETTVVTKAQEPEAEEAEAAAETVTEPTVTSVEKTDAAVSVFKPAPGNRRIGQYDDQMNLIAEYDSAAVAAKAVGSNRTSIRYCANGKQKHAGGYVWRYLDQEADQAE